MDFFDLGSAAESKLSMEHYREFAGEIAASYLHSGIEPTAALCKIAKSEELTPHQISVLAGEANKLIHSHKYAAAKEKYFAADFPHADAAKVLAELSLEPETKIAAFLPDPVVDDGMPDIHAMFGVKPEVMDKTAAVKHELKVAGEKAEFLREKLADKMEIEKCAAAAAERDFIKMARQWLITEDSCSSRMKALGTLDHFVKTAGMEFARATLAKVAYVLQKEGYLEPEQGKAAFEYFLSKEADIKAPPELISGFLPCQIVNGTHPLYITLKTYRDAKDRYNLAADRHTLVQDQLNILRQRVRAL